MAKKISDLTEDTSPSLTDYIETSKGLALSRRVSFQKVLNLLASLAAKTTMVAADYIVMLDSAASFIPKIITWTNFMVQVQAFGLKPNLLINGALELWQRGTSFAAIANLAYSADRIKYLKDAGTTAVHTLTRDTDVPTQAQAGVLANYSLKLDCTTADASIAAGEFVVLRYIMEGYDYIKVKEKTVTLSFWVKATKIGTYCIGFRNNGGDRTYIAEYSINTTLTWEKKTVTVALTQSGGTENYTTGAGLNISWVIQAGSTFQAPAAGVWNNANYLATANQVAGADSTSNDFWLALLKLEEGSSATDFTFDTFPDVLSRCKRYYHKSFEYATAPAQSAGAGTGELRWTAGIVATGAERSPTFPFEVEMRIAPTLTFYNPSAANANLRDITAGADGGAITAVTTSKNTVLTATGNAATVIGNWVGIHFSAEADI